MLFSKRRTLKLDLRVGGHGDNWMRLVSLYSIAKYFPEIEVYCLVPPIFKNLVAHVLGDRIQTFDFPDQDTITFTNRGLKHLLPEILKGKKFVVPYHRVNVKDWKKDSIKDKFNNFLFDTANLLNITQLPPWEALELYQGYLEVIAIKDFRSVNYTDFCTQAEIDFSEIFSRMNKDIPVSEDFILPDLDPDQAITVFPTGTAHQFMPLEWAVKNLPQAYYCFFKNDPERLNFEKAGLKIITFGKEPGDMVMIAQKSKRTISTDSFPSHILQFSIEHLTLALAEFPRRRIVSPFFRGRIVDSTAECSPCSHLERSAFPMCAKGHPFCISWNDKKYTHGLIHH
jgi:hypothetical protein